MAANMLPILAIAGAFLLLSKKKGKGAGNGNGGNGNGANGNGGEEPDGLMDALPPDWSKPTPAGDMNMSTSYSIGLRMGTGGIINEVVLEGPEGSNPDEDLRLEKGVGHEMLSIGFNEPGTWTVTLSGIAGDTQEPLTRSWKIEAYKVMRSQIHKKCPAGHIYTCATLGGQEQCWCQAVLADVNTSSKD